MPNVLSSLGISFQDSVSRTVLVCLVQKCNSLMLYSEWYACTVCGFRAVRLVKPSASFSGDVVWEIVLGSEAFLLGTCPAG